MQAMLIDAVLTFSGGECKLMNALPENATQAMYSKLDSKWVSSSMDCDNVADNFNSKVFNKT